jgi:hypothetical protein
MKNSHVFLYGLTFERNQMRRDKGEFLLKSICFSVVTYADSKYTIYFALVLGYDDKTGTTLN